MPTKKKASKTRKGATKGKTARVESGQVPPYGDPIHKAIARGDLQEMKATAASARKWVSEVNAALTKLDASIKKAGG